MRPGLQGQNSSRPAPESTVLQNLEKAYEIDHDIRHGTVYQEQEVKARLGAPDYRELLANGDVRSTWFFGTEFLVVEFDRVKAVSKDSYLGMSYGVPMSR